MKNWSFLFFVGFLCAVACNNVSLDEKQKHSVSNNESHNSVDSANKMNVTQIDANAWINGNDTLVPANYFNKQIYTELKYATASNFMNRVLYDTLKQVCVQIDVARKLAACQQFLTQKDVNLHLLVYDGVRPLSVQWEMWKALDSIPIFERGKFVSNPQNGSVHNYGCAVDLTICNSKKVALDMGAGYDDIRKIAYPSLEQTFLASGELTAKHISNRKLLRLVMAQQNFRNIPSEWWHFNAFPRPVAKAKFQLVKNEFLLNVIIN